jgi:hypothetical protein
MCRIITRHEFNITVSITFWWYTERDNLIVDI